MISDHNAFALRIILRATGSTKHLHDIECTQLHPFAFLRAVDLQFGASRLNEFTLERKLDLDEDDGEIVAIVVCIVCAIERYATCDHLKTQLLTQLLNQSKSVFLEQCLIAGYDLTGLASCLESQVGAESNHQSILKEHVLRHLPLLVKSNNISDILSLLWQIHCQATGATNTKAYHQTGVLELAHKGTTIQNNLDDHDTFEVFQRAGLPDTRMAPTVYDKQILYDRKTVANCKMQPLSLMQLCRNSVRNCCYTNVIYAHTRLGLPSALEEYVVLET